MQLKLYCLWKEILSQQRIGHFKILQSIYFAYNVGIISSYSNRISQQKLFPGKNANKQTQQKLFPGKQHEYCAS